MGNEQKGCVGCAVGCGVFLQFVMCCGVVGHYLPPTPDQVEAARKELQGTWIAISVEHSGKPVTSTENMRIIFNDDQVVFRVLGVQHKGNCSLDPREKPKKIDIMPSSDNSQDRPMQGIYEIDDLGRLRLCFSERKRPDAFATEQGKDWVMVVLRHQQE